MELGPQNHTVLTPSWTIPGSSGMAGGPLREARRDRTPNQSQQIVRNNVPYNAQRRSIYGAIMVLDRKAHARYRSLQQKSGALM